MNEPPSNRRAFVRFVLVGLSNTGIGWVVFWAGLHLLSGVRLRATVSQLVAYAIGTVWSFYWNRRWTFRSQGHVGKQAVKFVLLQGGCGLASAGALGVLVDSLAYHPALSWLAVMAVITVVNFVASRYWAFR